MKKTLFAHAKLPWHVLVRACCSRTSQADGTMPPHSSMVTSLCMVMNTVAPSKNVSQIRSDAGSDGTVVSSIIRRRTRVKRLGLFVAESWVVTTMTHAHWISKYQAVSAK